MGKIKRSVLNAAAASPITFYKSRADAQGAH